jgi:hypothetical protein
MGNLISIKSQNKAKLGRLLSLQAAKESNNDKTKFYKLLLGPGVIDSEGTQGLSGSLQLEKIRNAFLQELEKIRNSKLTGGENSALEGGGSVYCSYFPDTKGCIREKGREELDKLYLQIKNDPDLNIHLGYFKVSVFGGQTGVPEGPYWTLRPGDWDNVKDIYFDFDAPHELQFYIDKAKNSCAEKSGDLYPLYPEKSGWINSFLNENYESTRFYEPEGYKDGKWINRYEYGRTYKCNWYIKRLKEKMIEIKENPIPTKKEQIEIKKKEEEAETKKYREQKEFAFNYENNLREMEKEAKLKKQREQTEEMKKIEFYKNKLFDIFFSEENKKDFGFVNSKTLDQIAKMIAEQDAR